ncbi:MAG: sugar ABC transporter substrate-binding protein [Eubacteriales bacterium]|nr:sugar ABC transporter substrate-binding protein [Eubacteriales bacterium]
MKKKVLAGLLAAVMVMGLSACGSGETAATETGDAQTTEDGAEAETGAEDAAASGEGLHIGLAIQTLSNQVWAQQMEEITARGKEDGNQITVVDCDENANTQIDQIENFITSGVDVIIVQPVDPDAIEEICKEARDAGIAVVCWDEEMENSDFNWVIENYDLGKEIGTQAAAWINEKFEGGACEVAVLGYPQTPILLERENGILDALEELAPNAKVVANQPAIDTTEGLNAMETILQANPDVKVVCTIGGGGAAGANEAFKGFYGSEVPEEVGIFSTDLTDEAVASMQNGEFNRMVVAITGNAYVCGDEIYDLTIGYMNGEELEHNVYRDLIPVTIDNLSEMISQ